MSNRRALFLGIRVKASDGAKKVRVALPPIALYAMQETVSSFDAVTELIPGKAGQYARGARRALNMFLAGIMREGPSEYVRVDVQNAKESARVRIRTY